MNVIDEDRDISDEGLQKEADVALFEVSPTYCILALSCLLCTRTLLRCPHFSFLSVRECRQMNTHMSRCFKRNFGITFYSFALFLTHLLSLSLLYLSLTFSLSLSLSPSVSLSVSLTCFLYISINLNSITITPYLFSHVIAFIFYFLTDREIS